MNTREALGIEVRRVGLRVQGEALFERWGIEATLTLPGSGQYVRLLLEDERMLAAGLAQRSFIRHELLAIRERLFVGWHFAELKKENPDLVFVERWATCPEHGDRTIVQIDRKERVFSCAARGSALHTLHHWPEHTAIVRGGGIEVVQPEEES